MQLIQLCIVGNMHDKQTNKQINKYASKEMMCNRQYASD